MPRHTSRKGYQPPFIRPYTVPNAPYAFDNDDQDNLDTLEPLLTEQKKSFVCQQCRRPFTSSGHLSRHERIHTGEKRHKCPFPGCETSCSRPDNLQQHYRIHLSPGSRQSSYGRTRGAMKRDADSPLASPEQARPGHPISRPTRKPRPPSSKHPPRQIKSKPVDGAADSTDNVRIRLPSPVLPPRRRPRKNMSEVQFRMAVIPRSRSSSPDSLDPDRSPGGRASPIDLTVGTPFALADVPTPPDTPPPLEEAPLSARLARSATWTGVLPYSSGAPVASGSGSGSSSLAAHVVSTSSLAHAHGQQFRQDSRETSTSSSPIIPLPSRVDCENGKNLLFPQPEHHASSTFLRDRGIAAQSGVHPYEQQVHQQQVHYAMMAQIGLSLSRTRAGGTGYMSYSIHEPQDDPSAYLETVDGGYDGSQEQQGVVDGPPSSVLSSSPVVEPTTYSIAEQTYNLSPTDLHRDDLYQHQNPPIQPYTYGYEELPEDTDASSTAYPSAPPNTAHHPPDETQNSLHLVQGVHDGGMAYPAYDEVHSGVHREYHQYDPNSSQRPDYDPGPSQHHPGVPDGYASTDASDDTTPHGTSYSHRHAPYPHLYASDGNYEARHTQPTPTEYSRPPSTDGYYDQTANTHTLPEHCHPQDATEYHDYQYGHERGSQHNLVSGHTSTVQMMPDMSREGPDAHPQAPPPSSETHTPIYNMQEYFSSGSSQFFEGAQLDDHPDRHRSHSISPQVHTVRIPVEHTGAVASSQAHMEMDTVASAYPEMHAAPSHHVTPDPPHTSYGQYGQYGYSADYGEFREPAAVVQAHAPSDSPVHYTIAPSQTHYPSVHTHGHPPSDVPGPYPGVQYEVSQHPAPMYNMQAVERPHTPLPPASYNPAEPPPAPEAQLVHTRMLEPMAAMPFPAYPPQPPYRTGMYDHPHIALAPSLSRRASPLQYEALMAYAAPEPAQAYPHAAYHDATHARRHPQAEMFVRDAWGHATDWQHVNNGAATAAG